MLEQADALAVFKNLPCYKTIVKTLLQRQLQFILDQMSDEAGEESMILSASLQHGTISHLGSRVGRCFLNDKDELKTQFLTHCMTNGNQSNQTCEETQDKQNPERVDKRKHQDSHDHTYEKQSPPKKKKPLFKSSTNKPTQTEDEGSSEQTLNRSSHIEVGSRHTSSGSDHSTCESHNNPNVVNNKQASKQVSDNPSSGFNLAEPGNRLFDHVSREEIVGTSNEDIDISYDIKPDLNSLTNIKEYEPADKNHLSSDAGVGKTLTQTDIKQEPVDQNDMSFDLNEDNVYSNTQVLQNSKATGVSNVNWANTVNTKQKSVSQAEFIRVQSVNKTRSVMSNKIKDTLPQKISDPPPTNVSKVSKSCCKSTQFGGEEVVEYPKESRVKKHPEIDKEAVVLIKAIPGNLIKKEPLSADEGEVEKQTDVSEFHINDGVARQQTEVSSDNLTAGKGPTKSSDNVVEQPAKVTGKDPNATKARSTEQPTEISGENLGIDKVPNKGADGVIRQQTEVSSEALADTGEHINKTTDGVLERQDEFSDGDLTTGDNTERAEGLTDDFGEGPSKTANNGVLSETQTGRGRRVKTASRYSSADWSCDLDATLKEFLDDSESDEDVDDDDVEDEDYSDSDWGISEVDEQSSAEESDVDEAEEDVDLASLEEEDELPESSDTSVDKNVVPAGKADVGPCSRKLKESEKLYCTKNPGVYIKKGAKSQTNKSGREYDIKHACFYCGKLINKIQTHLQNSHKQEDDVIEIARLKKNMGEIVDVNIKKKLEKTLYAKQLLLKGKGDNKHNLLVMKLKKGEMIVSRRTKEFDSEAFGGCTECYEWLNLKSVNYQKHSKKCPGQRKSHLTLTVIQNLILQDKILASASKEMQSEVLETMKDDLISKTAKGDALIVALGEFYFMNSVGGSEKRRKCVEDKMRSAARLLLFVRRETKSEDATMSDCLTIENIDAFTKCAIIACAKVEKDLSNPLRAIKLGSEIVKLISAKIGYMTKEENEEEVQKAKAFHNLLQEEWDTRVQTQAKTLLEKRKARKTGKKQPTLQDPGPLQQDPKSSQPDSDPSQSQGKAKPSNPDPVSAEVDQGTSKSSQSKPKSSRSVPAPKPVVPDPEDLAKLAQYLFEQLSKTFTPVSISTVEQYRRLAMLTLAFLVLYNKPHAQELESLTVETYGRKLREIGEIHVGLQSELGKFDKYLLKTRAVLDLRGKGMKRIPMIIPMEVKQQLQVLTNPTVRQSGGVSQSNNYLFASDGKGPVRIEAAFYLMKFDAALKYPVKISPGSLPDYAATIAKVVCLKDEEVQPLATDMGLSPRIRLDQGQGSLGVQGRLDIVKVILMKERGFLKKFADVALSEIPFEDLVEAKESANSNDTENVNEDSPSEEEDFDDNQLKLQRLKKKSGNKVPWTKEETQEIYKFFMKYIKGESERPCPGIKEILQVRAKSRASGGKIWKRKWETIKKKVFNLRENLKRRGEISEKTASDTGKKVPWTEEETQEIHAFFMKYLKGETRRPCPGIKEILQVCAKSRANGGEIWKRNWESIKKKVFNLRESLKRHGVTPETTASDTETKGPWSKEESDEIRTYFKKYLEYRTCPVRTEIEEVCEKSRANGGLIWRRRWDSIKKKIARNIQDLKQDQQTKDDLSFDDDDLFSDMFEDDI